MSINDRSYKLCDTEDDFIEVNILSDVYKKIEKEENGELVEDYILIKKDARSKQIIWKNEISSLKQVFNDKGNIKIKQVELGIKYKDPIIVEGNYKQLKQSIFELPKPVNKSIGFKI